MMKWINKKRNQKGFTLIELVVVIAILGILMAIAIPRLGGFQENARIRADEASAATIARAAEMVIASTNATTVPAYADLPADMVEAGIKFKSKKYGPAGVPSTGGTVDNVTVVTDGGTVEDKQVYPVPAP